MLNEALTPPNSWQLTRHIYTYLERNFVACSDNLCFCMTLAFARTLRCQDSHTTKTKTFALGFMPSLNKSTTFMVLALHRPVAVVFKVTHSAAAFCTLYKKRSRQWTRRLQNIKWAKVFYLSVQKSFKTPENQTLPFIDWIGSKTWGSVQSPVTVMINCRYPNSGQQYFPWLAKIYPVLMMFSVGTGWLCFVLKLQAITLASFIICWGRVHKMYDLFSVSLHACFSFTL